MSPAEIDSLIQQKLGKQNTAINTDDKQPRIHCDAANWRTIAEFLIREPQLQLDWLQNLSGVDYVADDKMCVVYDLWSFQLRHEFGVKVYCPRDNPHVPSVTDLWPAANWHER